LAELYLAERLQAKANEAPAGALAMTPLIGGKHQPAFKCALA
jgi:hypothetical protein